MFSWVLKQVKRNKSKLYFGIGILCFLIPVVLQIINNREQEQLIASYEKLFESYDEEEMEQCLARAVQYNMTRTGDYETQLNLAGTGMMGSIEIPTIKVQLPIYHGTADDVLARGVGHIKETSLPIGGEGCHAVLTGHCGLPNAELFTRLDELEKGDCFYINVCGKVLGYEVIRVLVVEPDNISVMEPENEKDLISLVTCTPYGINSHRLVVTGERMQDVVAKAEMSEEPERGVDEKVCYLAVISLVLFICLVCRSVSRKYRDYRENRRENRSRLQ